MSQVHSEHSAQLLNSQNLLLFFPSQALRLTALREGVAVQTGSGACRVSHGLITHLPENETIIIFHPTHGGITANINTKPLLLGIMRRVILDKNTTSFFPSWTTTANAARKAVVCSTNIQQDSN